MSDNIVTIRFRPALSAMNAAGTKTRTTRIERKGNPGDIFFDAGICYRLIRVEQMEIGEALRGWNEEGYSRLYDMARELLDIYGSRLSGRKLWVHWYTKWYPEMEPIHESFLVVLGRCLEGIVDLVPGPKRHHAMELLEEYVHAVEEVLK